MWAKPCPVLGFLREQQHTLPQPVLQSLLAATVRDLREEVPGLGEVVAFDVTHIYAYVKENNLAQSTSKTAMTNITNPKGIAIAKWGSRRAPTKSKPMAPRRKRKSTDGGYGSGVASATIAIYGDVVLAEYTLPFNENDIMYFFPLYIRTVGTLGFFPTHLTADAAFDAWYVYEVMAHRHGMAAIPLNTHGHLESRRAPDGVPLCEKGLRMHPTFQFSHTGRLSQAALSLPAALS